MKKFKPTLCAICRHEKKEHQADACSYTCHDEDLGGDITMSPDCDCKRFVGDDGNSIRVKEEFGTPIFEPKWGSLFDIHVSNLIYARQQMLAIIYGWADPVEW